MEVKKDFEVVLKAVRLMCGMSFAVMGIGCFMAIISFYSMGWAEEFTSGGVENVKDTSIFTETLPMTLLGISVFLLTMVAYKRVYKKFILSEVSAGIDGIELVDTKEVTDIISNKDYKYCIKLKIFGFGNSAVLVTQEELDKLKNVSPIPFEIKKLHIEEMG